ncbi:hypothetical protein ACFVH6_22245 [Spirillospora sp. NPDC127200]
MTFLSQVREVWRVLRGGVPCERRQCTRCGRTTTRLRGAQLAGAGRADWQPPCQRAGCDGLMPRVLDGVPPHTDLLVHDGTRRLMAALRKGASE